MSLDKKGEQCMKTYEKPMATLINFETERIMGNLELPENPGLPSQGFDED